jgi:FkbM family methyltransferase
MGIGSLVRSIVPPQTRASLRRLGVVNRALAFWYGGVKHVPHPHAPQYQFYFDGYRNIGWTLGGLSSFESGEFQFVRDLLKRKRVACAWDVGANVGLWSLFFAGIEPPIKEIVALEPDQANLKFLRINKEKNKIDRLRIRDVALSAEPGTTTFYADGMTGSTGGLERESTFIESMYGGKRQEIQVQVSTVDAEIASGLPAPQFMKIDVEGHELSVLKGAKKMLAQHRPPMILEVLRNHDEIADLLRRYGYQFFNAMDGKPIDRPEVETACVHASDL